MSSDTEHVRNAGDTPGLITGIPTVAELLENPSLASLYTSIRRSGTATGPELVETMPVSKKTVYDYLLDILPRVHAGESRALGY